MTSIIKGNNDVDTQFDFTSDSPRYWDNFWENRNGLGIGNSDPDVCSKTLQKYHQILWSKPLPNGEYMDLKTGSGNRYLTWKEFRFGSDSITASFRYKDYKLIKEVEKTIPDYHSFMEEFIRKTYTIGGMMIFPKRRGGINQARGFHAQIRDRWDLTLECIRRYYLHEESPLYYILQADKPFFDLFVDFKGFVEFFFLQDCVNEGDYSVIFWLGDGDFHQKPLPETIDDYIIWIHHNLEFVKRRNERIQKALSQDK